MRTETEARIHALEARTRDLGLRSQRWAAEVNRASVRQEKALALCSACQLRFETS